MGLWALTLALGVALLTNGVRAQSRDQPVAASSWQWDTSLEIHSAPSAPKSQEELCRGFGENPHYFHDLLKNSKNRLAFSNPAGFLRTGLCWWHSRLQRNATYLAVFRPDLPKLSRRRERKIIEELTKPYWEKRRRIVEVPGYRDLSEWSRASSKAMISELNQWQWLEAAVGGAWWTGLSGKSSTSAAEMKAIVDDVYEKVQWRNELVFQMLQIKGINAHSWLVHEIEPTAEGGYLIRVIDSNFLQPRLWIYRPGDQAWDYFNVGNFVPFEKFQDEEMALWQTVARACL